VAAPSLDYSATDWYSIITHKLHEMKSEQAVLPNPCLEEEEEDHIGNVEVELYSIHTSTLDKARLSV
jgi:hypothetical protein